MTLDLTKAGLITSVARLRREREERAEHPAEVAAKWSLPLCMALAGYEPLAAMRREAGVR